MHDARNNSGHMHDAQALAMHDARNENNAMHVHTICKNPMIGARKKGMGTLLASWDCLCCILGVEDHI